MVTGLGTPVASVPRRYGPLRSAVAVAAASLAVFCLLHGLSFPGFPVWSAGWGVSAAVVAVTLVIASAVRAVVGARSRRRSALTLVVVTLLLVAGVVAAEQDDGARLADR